jgi:hypothetical protein
MKTLKYMIGTAAAALVLLAALAACKLPEQPEKILDPSSSAGDEDEDPRGGKILDANLALFNQPGGIFELEDGQYTTPETVGRTKAMGEDETVYETDSEEHTLGGKYVLQGAHLVSTSKLDTGGLSDVQFFHYTEPVSGDFTMRARVRMTARNADSSNKGYVFGAFEGHKVTDPKSGVERVEFEGMDRGAGVFYRTRDSDRLAPAVRYYFSSTTETWSVGPSISMESSYSDNYFNWKQPNFSQELIVETVRCNITTSLVGNASSEVGYIFRVYDAKTLTRRAQKYVNITGNPNGLILKPSLVTGEPVYLGIALFGSAVEFSQFSIWDEAYTTDTPLEARDTPIFATPDTKPAYVPVDDISINCYYPSSSTAFNLRTHLTLPSTSVNGGSGGAISFAGTAGGNPDAERGSLRLAAAFSPTYADNLFCDWKVLALPYSVDLEDIEIKGIEGKGSVDTGWTEVELSFPKAVVGQNTTTEPFIIMATSRDSGLADWSLQLIIGN